MKIIFFGTPLYVVPILEALHKKYNSQKDRGLIGVVTQPPQKSGRDQKITYSEADHFAHKHKIPIYFDFEDLPAANLGVCAAYGRIIPKEVIANFKHGILNVHPSLLPLWKGASPTQAAILSDYPQTGVSVIKMDEKMDHGPIVSSFKSQINEGDTNDTLRTRLFQEAVPFLLDLIEPYYTQKIKPKEQDHARETITLPLRREDGFVPGKFISSLLQGETLDQKWKVGFIKDCEVELTAQRLEKLTRALSPWPQVYTEVVTKGEKRRLKIMMASVVGKMLILEKVQLEGKNEVSWEQFTEGYPDFEFV